MAAQPPGDRHIFLGFSKCGRYVLSYTSSGGDDVFSFYMYHLYWWEFNVHSRLRLVRQVRLFQDEEIYSDLYLTVCEWPGDSSKVIVFGFNTRSASVPLLNMLLLSDENHRDIYVSVVASPPGAPCAACRAAGAARAQCVRHGFVLHTKYQVVYPFPTFQPAFQLKKDHVVLLNTSYSLVACAVAVGAAGDGGAADAELSPKASPCGAEPGYVNYTRLRYVLEPGEPGEPADAPGPAEYEDDKISLPFVVTDLRGRSLKPLR
ncbi:DDB1- and CUL4-associated factor 15, partial [Nothoprocta perdicaria]|uniref:DDB1- and CUL4-associated factor 15 n=1 Tax=Nothoprocta perdicaria TaxID=30464 RepID=UPI000E1C23AD